MGIQKDRIKFNVGGRKFETTAATLVNAGRNSYLGALFDDEWNLLQTDNKSPQQQELFIDRNPDCFYVLLDLLRTGDLHVPPTVSERFLLREALFYGLIDHVRLAKWGTLDANRLILTRSVTGCAPGCGMAVRAGPDGGCCVAHGSLVHVFDWMLEEHPSINLDYHTVSDMGWIDSNSIVVSSGGGGMGLFSSSSGELRHKYLAKSYSVGALCFSPDHKILASCRSLSSTEDGVGVWDQLTGNRFNEYLSLVMMP